MGYIDESSRRLSCATCKTSEVAKVLDRGNRHSPPHWDNYGPCEHFTLTETGGGLTPPKIISALCKTCDQAATIEREP